MATVLISPGWLEPGFRFQTGTGNPGSTRIRYDPYYEFISNSDVILRTRGGGGQKRPKFCVRTKWMLPM